MSDDTSTRDPADDADDDAPTTAHATGETDAPTTAHDTGNDSALRELSGSLASSVAAQLASPLRTLRENLAVLVESLDRYVSSAQGPAPYPWRSLQVLRQDLADAYLLSRDVSRTASDLAECVGTATRAPSRVDINEKLEAALNLIRHRVSAQTEVFVDLEELPPVRAASADLVLALATIALACVESANQIEGSAVSIKTRAEPHASETGGHGDAHKVICVYIADNGRGATLSASAAAVVQQVSDALGASLEHTSEPGQGSVYEWRIPESR